jgi:hypothetical protein
MFLFWWLLVSTSPHFLPLCKLRVWMVHEDLQSKCNSTLDNFAYKKVFFSHLFVLFVCLVLSDVVSCGMFLIYLFVSFWFFLMLCNVCFFKIILLCFILEDHLFQCSFMVWSKREWSLTCIPKHYFEHTNQFWACIYYYQHTLSHALCIILKVNDYTLDFTLYL